MIGRRTIVKTAFAIGLGSVAISHEMDAARAETAWPSKSTQTVRTGNPQPSVFQYAPDDVKTWKSVEYLNRPIESYICDGANKVQVICFRH